jgi:hypothetical protein
MKKLMLFSVLLISSAIFAAPNSAFNWTAPTNYEDGTIIDPGVDVLTYSIYCSDTQGGLYNLVEANLSSSPQNVDVASCVQGIPGTYYFVMTAVSTFYNTESGYSNEISRTYSATELGKTPNAPVLLSIN